MSDSDDRTVNQIDDPETFMAAILRKYRERRMEELPPGSRKLSENYKRATISREEAVDRLKATSQSLPAVSVKDRIMRLIGKLKSFG
jgi:hypothetical protein